MIVMSTTACTPQVQQYRNLFRTAAVRAIGKVPSELREGGWQLDRSAIPGYLVSIGCPFLLDGPPSLLMIKEDNVRTAVDEAAKSGWFPNDRAGMALSGNQRTAMKYAVVTSSEFLRRKHNVAWRSAEQIVETAPRRVVETEEDMDINDEFYMLTDVYELLVIHGVQSFGQTEHEERAIGRMLSCRLTMFLPTVVVLAPSVGTKASDQSPINQYLVNNYLTVNL
jgi:hypothetical protein